MDGASGLPAYPVVVVAPRSPGSKCGTVAARRCPVLVILSQAVLSKTLICRSFNLQSVCGPLGNRTQVQRLPPIGFYAVESNRGPHFSALAIAAFAIRNAISVFSSCRHFSQAITNALHASSKSGAAAMR